MKSYGLAMEKICKNRKMIEHAHDTFSHSLTAKNCSFLIICLV